MYLERECVCCHLLNTYNVVYLTRHRENFICGHKNIIILSLYYTRSKTLKLFLPNIQHSRLRTAKNLIRTTISNAIPQNWKKNSVTAIHGDAKWRIVNAGDSMGVAAAAAAAP